MEIKVSKNQPRKESGNFIILLSWNSLFGNLFETKHLLWLHEKRILAEILGPLNKHAHWRMH